MASCLLWLKLNSKQMRWIKMMNGVHAGDTQEDYRADLHQICREGSGGEPWLCFFFFFLAFLVPRAGISVLLSWWNSYNDGRGQWWKWWSASVAQLRVVLSDDSCGQSEVCSVCTPPFSIGSAGLEAWSRWDQKKAPAPSCSPGSKVKQGHNLLLTVSLVFINTFNPHL